MQGILAAQHSTTKEIVMKNKQEPPIRITARITIEIDETSLPGVPVREWLEPVLLKVAPAFHSPARAEPPPPKAAPVDVHIDPKGPL